MCDNGKNELGGNDCVVEILSGRCILAKDAKGCRQFTDFAEKYPVSAGIIRAHAEISGQFEGA